jgi:1-acyl-sn-glycerol-3-phosphate acyltransferase
LKILIDSFKVFWLFFWVILATGVIGTMSLIAGLLGRGNLAFTIARSWTWFLPKIIGLKMVIRGREKIEPGQSYVIISNHQSHFDIFALMTLLGVQYRWVLKKELRRVPLFGYALYQMDNIYVDRSDNRKAVESIREGVKRLPPGVSVLFFAEGTRSPDYSIQEFKKGGFVTAVESGLPILPVTVNGSRRALPRGSVVFRRSVIEVVVGDPIDTSGYTHQDIGELMGRTRKVIVDNFDPEYPRDLD